MTRLSSFVAPSSLDSLPVTWWPSESMWREVTVDEGCVILQKNGGYMRSPPCFWCGADACYTVTRVSRFSDNRYTDYACDHHALGWLPA